jgi:hypothetical protein
LTAVCGRVWSVAIVGGRTFGVASRATWARVPAARSRRRAASRVGAAIGGAGATKRQSILPSGLRLSSKPGGADVSGQRGRTRRSDGKPRSTDTHTVGRPAGIAVRAAPISRPDGPIRRGGGCYAHGRPAVKGSSRAARVITRRKLDAVSARVASLARRSPALPRPDSAMAPRRTA